MLLQLKDYTTERHLKEKAQIMGCIEWGTHGMHGMVQERILFLLTASGRSI